MPEFATPQQLIRHLNFHVLSPPESHAWGLIWRGRFSCLAADPTAEKTCFRLRNMSDRAIGNADEGRSDVTVDTPTADGEKLDSESLWKELLHAYHTETERVQVRSERLGWRTSRDGGSVHFDPYGIVLICFERDGKPIALTAYVAGATSIGGVLRSHEAPDDAHTRAGGRSRMRRHTGPDQGDVRDRMEARRVTTWNEDQKIYFLVFRPAVQFIRGRQPGSPVPGVSEDSGVPIGAGNSWGRRKRVEMADVKAALPRMSQLDYDGWRKYLADAECESTSNSPSRVQEKVQ